MVPIFITIWRALKSIEACTPFPKRKLQMAVYPTYIHTYTYIIGHYNPSVRIIDLVSHTTFVVCVNFIYKWQNLQFNSERQPFRKLFMAILFLTLRVFTRNLLRENRQRNIFPILFWCLAWPVQLDFTNGFMNIVL